jgi:hypothetical protein
MIDNKVTKEDLELYKHGVKIRLNLEQLSLRLYGTVFGSAILGCAAGLMGYGTVNSVFKNDADIGTYILGLATCLAFGSAAYLGKLAHNTKKQRKHVQEESQIILNNPRYIELELYIENGLIG